MPAQDPLLDFSPETTVEYAEHGPSPSPWSATLTPTHAIDTTSRVISFVLGFALASLIAWLGSIGGSEVVATAATSATESVATPVIPVVTAATEEKTAAIVARDVPPPPPPQPVTTAQPAPRAARPPTARLVTAQPQRTAVSGYRGAVAFSSTPEGADVLVNGRTVGQTPVVVNDLPVGSRVVVVRREGYAPWSASIRVVANQRTTVRATLTPAQQTGG